MKLRIIRKIKNFFYWGWRMRDRHYWDYTYLMATMGDFFEIMENGIKKEDRHSDASMTARQLMICKNLCRRIVEDDWQVPPWLEIEYKYHTEPMENGCARMISDNTPQERKILSEAVKHREFIYKHHIDLLCKMMSRHMKGWWS